MKVRELIEHLKTLDPERNVWVVYDSFVFYQPDFSDVASGVDEQVGRRAGVQKGDYIMEVG